MILTKTEGKGKFKRGQQFVIEIAEVHTHYNDNGEPYPVYRIKGFDSLVLTDYGIQRILEVTEPSKIKVGQGTMLIKSDDGVWKCHSTYDLREEVGIPECHCKLAEEKEPCTEDDAEEL